MRKTLLFGLTIAAGLAAMAWTRASATEESPRPEEASELLDEFQERVARLDTLYVTARGPDLRFAGWESPPDGEQARVPQDTVDKVLEIRDRRTAHLTIGGYDQVSMDLASYDEGRLFRIHVDRPDSGDVDDCGTILVIGIYDRLWSKGAVDDQRYACKECESIIVCGANPQCY